MGTSTSERPEGKASPIPACTLTSEDFRRQAERWRALWHEAGLECSRTTGGGKRLSFRDERAVEQELQALVAAERDCCAWAHWEIRREADALVLDVATGVGVAALQIMFSRGSAT